ncbi:MAG TPA: cysteine hydrolase [Candidatus Merdibacter merdavium]|uniref:Cysteine hydrolase n=1 Tax=Candidatus Merdibacter merdavium TaxID=2838692 RepID=A0A9D2NPT8_9FIRM|nr:cysteine hydrolase [Candidatus Merdibacter merdavium]
MARMNMSETAPMPLSALSRPLHFVVDMVNGFVKEGALHDDAIRDLCVPIRSLIDALQCRTLFVADSHPPMSREFITYPKHCVIGSGEDEVIDELQPYIHQLIRKNSTNAFFAPDFQQLLQEELTAYRDIIITGCCTDICIMQFALTLNAWLNEHNHSDMRVIVPLDCVDTYHIEGVHDAFACNAFAIANMKGNGILVPSSIQG